MSTVYKPPALRRAGSSGPPPGLAPRQAQPSTSPEVYGLSNAEGLPSFPGEVAAAGHGDPAAFVAAVCHASMKGFQEKHAHNQELLPAVETALRRVAQHLTPTDFELDQRCLVMDKLRALAQTGISFCLGLDLEPYGSFVSGLYTPRGDLDLSIEGAAMWTGEDGNVQKVDVHSMDREQQQRFLRALSNRIERGGMARGRIERVLHARVPIIKFREATSGLECDVGICAGGALFKSTVLGLLAQYDWRVGALVRLVKSWARKANINDSAAGTINSFALSLMAVWHLQTRSPPVLPALCELFAGPYSGDAPRPMQAGAPPNFALLQRGATYLCTLSRQGGHGNSETLLELLSSFFSLGAALMGPQAWGHTDEAAARVLRCVRLDTWAGQMRHGNWDRPNYYCSVEDPFDSTDNCARTVRRPPDFEKVANAFATAEKLVKDLSSQEACERAMLQLFGAELTRHAALRPLLMDAAGHAAIPWIKPVDLIVPPRLQPLVAHCLPRAVWVSHKRPRGAEDSGMSVITSAAALDREMQALALGQSEKDRLAEAASKASTGGTGEGSSGGAGGSGSSGAGGSSQLAMLWRKIAPLVAEEAAILAKKAAREREEEDARKVKRDERRVAKRAAQEAKRAELAAARAEKRKADAEAKAVAAAAVAAETAAAEREGGGAAAAVPAAGGAVGTAPGVLSAAAAGTVAAVAPVAGAAGAATAQKRERRRQQQQQHRGAGASLEGAGIESQAGNGPAAAGGAAAAAAAAGRPPGLGKDRGTAAAATAAAGGGNGSGRRERQQQQQAPKRNFGAVMRRLAAEGGGSEEAWSAAFAALHPAESQMLRARGISSYAAFTEDQLRFQQQRAGGGARQQAGTSSSRAPLVLARPGMGGGQGPAAGAMPRPVATAAAAAAR